MDILEVVAKTLEQDLDKNPEIFKQKNLLN
jgi:hypothetical protein